MDSGSRKRRLEDKETQVTKHMKISHQETTETVNEEMPKILSPAVLDVLPVFANMLDLKSFMQLAMSCKDMYNRCNEDKRICINVDENKLEVITGRGPPKFAWRLENDPRKHREEYLTRLQELGALTVKRLRFSDIQTATDDHSVTAACDYLRKMRVKNITELEVTGNFIPWELLPSIIEEFHVKRLEINTRNRISAEALVSSLSLNLELFRCHETVPVDVLVQVVSPIPKIEFRSQEINITRNNFTSILSLIHEDRLLNLTINTNAVAPYLNQALPYGFEGLIPDDRPLVFHRSGGFPDEYFFLHSNCDVTKGVIRDFSLELFKCGKSDYPPILKKDEEATEDLLEVMKCAMNWRDLPDTCDSLFGKHWRASCSLDHLRSSFMKFPSLFKAPQEGPLPTERPLLCVGSAGHFWFLNLHDMLMEFTWKNGEASWKMIEGLLRNYPSFNHAALEKYVIKKSFERTFVFAKRAVLENVPKNVLMSVFEDLKTLPMEYDGPLPVERPILFEGKESRVVLARDSFIYKCEFYEDYGRISKCPPSKLPPSLVNEKDVERILKGEEGFLNKVNLLANLETFQGGFSSFKMIPFDHEGPLPNERPLVLLKTQNSDDEVVEQRLFIHHHKFVNCEWKNGLAMFSEADPREFPQSVVESHFNHLLKEKSSSFTILTFFLKLDTVEKCLSPFKVLPYDYDGPVPEDDIVIFTKTEIKDGCRIREQTGDWPEKMMTIWMLKDGMELTFATWGEMEPSELNFSGLMDPDDVPPALKTKEYLKRLLLMNNYNKDGERVVNWYGDEDVFDACLNEFTRLPYFFDGELPQGPLVFDVDDGFGEVEWVVFREDGSLIRCYNAGEEFTITGGGSISCPPAIRHLCPLAL